MTTFQYLSDEDIGLNNDGIPPAAIADMRKQTLPVIFNSKPVDLATGRIASTVKPQGKFTYLSDEDIGVASPQWTPEENKKQTLDEIFTGKTLGKQPALDYSADVGVSRRMPIDPDMSKPSFIRPGAGRRSQISERASAGDIGSLPAAMDLGVGMFLGQPLHAGVFSSQLARNMIDGTPKEYWGQIAKDVADNSIPEAFSTPFRTIMHRLGFGNVYDSSTVYRAMSQVGEAVGKGGEHIQEKFGLPKEVFEEFANTLMSFIGAKGVKTELSHWNAKKTAAEQGWREMQQYNPNPNDPAVWRRRSPTGPMPEEPYQGPIGIVERGIGGEAPESIQPPAPIAKPKVTLGDIPRTSGVHMDQGLLEAIAGSSTAAAVGGLTYMHPDEAKDLGLDIGKVGAVVIPAIAGRKLDRARELERSGSSKQVIWDETQYVRQKDGIMKREVPDDKMALVQDWRQYLTDHPDGVPLSHVVMHEELYKAAPWAQDIKIKFDDDPGYNGRYSPTTNTIKINSKTSAPLDTIVHELDHAMQHHYGMMTGTSPRAFMSAADAGAPKRISAEFRPIAEDVRKEYGPSSPNDLAQAFYKDQKGYPLKSAELQILQELDNSPKLQALWQKLKEYDKARDTYNAAHENYYRTGGEIGARATARRRELTEEQRKERPLWKDYDRPEDQWLVSFGSRAPSAAVKEPGGSWNKRAVDALSSSLQRTLVSAGTLEAEKASVSWADRTVKNYLNRYFGTKEDPLRDIRIPIGDGSARWEDLTDRIVYPLEKGTQAKFDNEFTIQPEHGQAAQRAIRSYLEHAGDYLRLNVPAEKLPQYDFVRTIKETSAWDERMAREAEKEHKVGDAWNKKQMETMPVHKDYGDGMKWVQLTKPGEFAYESTKMGHSVRGYEPALDAGGGNPHPDWNEKSEYGLPKGERGSGDPGYGSTGVGWDGIKTEQAKVYSLRDAEGKPHVTVEVVAKDALQDFKNQGGDYAATVREYLDSNYSRIGGFNDWLVKRHPELWKDFIEHSESPYIIAQIKGKGNKAPLMEDLKYVQDFIKGGKWGDVKDLENAGLWKAKDGRYYTKTEVDASEQLTNEYAGRNVGKSARNFHDAAGDWEPEDPGFNQQGSINPKLAKPLILAGVGALAGGLLADKDSKLSGMLKGGFIGLMLSPIKMRAAFNGIKDVLNAKPTAPGLDDLRKWHDGNVKVAKRAIYQAHSDFMEKVPDAKGREAITDAIAKKPGVVLKKNEQEALVGLLRWYDNMGKLAKNMGVDKQAMEVFTRKIFDVPSSRVVDDVSNFTPITRDAAGIMQLYGDSVINAVESKRFITRLRNLENPLTEKPLVMSAEDAPRNYVNVDHPLLRGKLVDPDIASDVKMAIGGLSDNVLLGAADTISTVQKRAAVSDSMFHTKALGDAYLGAASIIRATSKGLRLSPITTIKVFAQSIAPRLFGEHWAITEIRKGPHGDFVDEFLRGGLELSYQRGVPAVEEMNKGFYEFTGKLQRHLDSIIPYGGVPIKALNAANHMFDNFMWGRFSASLKIELALDALEKLQRYHPEMPRAKAVEAAATHANDIFGGQNWTRLSMEFDSPKFRKVLTALLSPEGRRILRIMEFAPDWTISTTRPIYKGLSTIPKDMAESFKEGGGGTPGALKALKDITLGPLMPRTLGDLSRGYAIRSLFWYAVLYDWYNYMQSGHHLWENNDPTRVDKGDGRTQQMSKHAMEPYHWMQHPIQQFLNKLGFLPKEVSNQVLGTEYLYPHKDKQSGQIVAGPPMKTDRLTHAAKQFVPISVIQGMETSKDVKSGIGDILFGIGGMPIYGVSNEQKDINRKTTAQKKASKTWDQAAEELDAINRAKQSKSSKETRDSTKSIRDSQEYKDNARKRKQLLDDAKKRLER